MSGTVTFDVVPGTCTKCWGRLQPVTMNFSTCPKCDRAEVQAELKREVGEVGEVGVPSPVVTLGFYGVSPTAETVTLYYTFTSNSEDAVLAALARGECPDNSSGCWFFHKNPVEASDKPYTVPASAVHNGVNVKAGTKFL